MTTLGSVAVDAEATEQGRGVQRGSRGPQTFSGCTACQLCAMGGQDSSRGGLDGRIVRPCAGPLRVAGNELGFSGPDLGAVSHAGRPLADAEYSGRVWYSAAEIHDPGGYRAHGAGWFRQPQGASDGRDVVFEHARAEQVPG